LILKIVIFILALYPNLYAQNNLTMQYRWQAENSEQKEFRGQCFEVDRETNGRKYLAKAPASKCRPSSKDKIKKIWIPKVNGPGGKCYEIDTPTQGENYSKVVSWKQCTPLSPQYVLNEGKCYLIGQFSEAPFIQAVKYDFCKSKQLIYQFQLSENNIRGTCLEIDQVNQISRSTPLTQCRPDETEGGIKYIFLREKQQCFEIAAQGGPNRYIAPVKEDLCRPQQTSFHWVQSQDPHCLEVGSHFELKVEDDKCLEGIERIPLFIKTGLTSGQCFEVDKETGGTKVRKQTKMNLCKDLVKQLNYQIVTQYNKEYCLEYDAENTEEGYRKTVNLNQCTVSTHQYRWQQDPLEAFSGECLKKELINGKASWKRTQQNLCRPKETRFYWYRPERFPEKWLREQKKSKATNIDPQKALKNQENLLFFGQCYEIEKNQGPLHFSISATKEKCKPDNTTLRYFHPYQFIKAGCFVVDKETQGHKYLKKTMDKLCKIKFL